MISSWSGWYSYNDDCGDHDDCNDHDDYGDDDHHDPYDCGSHIDGENAQGKKEIPIKCAGTLAGPFVCKEEHTKQE